MFPKNKKEHCEILSSDSSLKVCLDRPEFKVEIYSEKQEKVLKKSWKKQGIWGTEYKQTKDFFSTFLRPKYRKTENSMVEQS